MRPKLASYSTFSGLIKRRVEDIVKSPEDKRIYRGYELVNNMKVLLISDAETDKSAASLDISIGSMSDPVELPGLAHYCEHMLFMGTEKYPIENDYDNYLSLHGGYSNAYTTNDHTNYHFDVARDALSGAIDRFAQFFISPTFNKNSSEREVMAVDSEFSDVLHNDDVRLSNLEHRLSAETHPFSRFNYGNKFSLWENPVAQYKLDPHQELLKFYNTHYSANLMRLSVLGRESLDDLEEMVIPLFAKVKDKKLERPSWLSHPYGAGQVKKKVRVVPIKDLRKLYLQFPTPDLLTYHRSKPEIYVSHLLGHEGSTSFLAELKRRGWAKEITAEYSSPALGFGFFAVEIDLSPEGLRKVDDIVILFFQYMHSTLNREQTIEEWVHREVERLNRINFTFADKMKPEDYVTHITPHMHDYDLKDVLFSPAHAMPDFNPQFIRLLLDLINPDNMLIAVVAKDFEGKTDKVEKWFGINYSIEPLQPLLIDQCLKVDASPKFALPSKNEFIPENFDILSKFDRELNAFPIVRHNDPIYRCWHKQDGEFSTPKLCSFIRFRNPSLFSKPADVVAAALLCESVKDAGTDYIYDAQLSGLSLCLLHDDRCGIDLKLDGFREKHAHFLRKLLSDLTGVEPDVVRFEMLKESYLRKLNDFHKKEPYKQASHYLNLLMYEKYWSVNELLNEAGSFTLDRLKLFRTAYFQNLHVEVYSHGNTSEKESTALADTLKSELGRFSSIRPLFSSQLAPQRSLKLLDGGAYLYEALNTTHSNSCSAILLQTCLENPKTNMLTELTQQIFREQFFNQLRTKEQLGYVVCSGVKNFNGARCIYLVVQGGQNPVFIENRIESFLKRMQKDIEEMSEEEFVEHKEALATVRLDKPKTLLELCERYWDEIIHEQYHFDRDESEVKVLRDITKEALVEFYKEYVRDGGARRKKLSIHVYSATDGQLQDKNGLVINKRRKNNATPISDVTSFKSGLPLYEAPCPYTQVPPAGLITDEHKSKL